MLKVDGLTKKFGKTVANDNLSFTVNDGTVAVLLGPNGAGKSTAFKAIIGFLKYDGLVTVNDYVNKSIEAKRYLGYVPELPAFYPNLTVKEHLEFIARAYKLKNYKEYEEELLKRFELYDKKDKFGDELSKGMQQKLSICCALLPKPKVILFDEPMVGLDPHAIKELKKVFIELKNEGAALLISTHIIDSIEDIWDETFIMQSGKIKACVTREELKKTGKTLEDIFFEVTEGENEALEDEKVENAENKGEEK